jgi:RNA polymerase-binding transcription factor DksA
LHVPVVLNIECITADNDAVLKEFQMSDAIRNVGLRHMLSERRREMQDDIEGALLQGTADGLRRIDHAIALLDQGKYGACVECEGEISERRLRALPFVLRCQTCDWKWEEQQGRARQFAHRDGPSLFPDVVGP